MAVSKAAQDLEELMTCAVCLNVYSMRSPRSLSCLHTFCEKCIQDVYEADVRRNPSLCATIRCPTCTQQTSLPDASIDSLPASFVASQVGDVVQQLRQMQTDHNDTRTDKKDANIPGDLSARLDNSQSNYCLKHTEVKVQSYCFDCGQTMCRECEERHEFRHHDKEHVCCPADGDIMKALLCPQHSEVYEKHCIDCMTPACLSCLMTSHNQHNVVRFTIKPTITSKEMTLIAERRMLNKQRNIDLENVRVQAQKKAADIKTHMAEYKRILVRKLDEHFVRLTAQLDEACDVIVQENHCHVSNVGSEDALLDQLEKQINDVASPIPAVPGLSLSNAKVLLDKIQTKLPQGEHIIDRELNLQFVSGSQQIKDCGSLVKPSIKQKGQGTEKTRKELPQAEHMIHRKFGSDFISGIQQTHECDSIVEATKKLKKNKHRLRSDSLINTWLNSSIN